MKNLNLYLRDGHISVTMVTTATITPPHYQIYCLTTVLVIACSSSCHHYELVLLTSQALAQQLWHCGCYHGSSVQRHLRKKPGHEAQVWFSKQ